MLYALFDTTFFGLILSPLTTVVTDPVNKFIYLAIMLVIFASCVVTATFSILSGRLSHTRIRQTDIGSVDIGVDAMESIVLNSAKSAQVGIKSATHVHPPERCCRSQ